MDATIFAAQTGLLNRCPFSSATMRRSFRLALASLSVAVVFALSASQAVRADSSAPFGLIWGMTLEAVEAKGAAVRPLFTDGPEKRVVVKKLPKMLNDMDEAILTFGPDNQLRRIESRGKDIRHDEDGAQLKARYKALSRALSGKYGKGETHHDISITWRKPTEFLMGLYRGDSVYYTTFKGEEVDVRLEIRATRRFVGHYRLIFEYSGIQDSGDKSSKERDIL
jgi:hypothetical protein